MGTLSSRSSIRRAAGLKVEAFSMPAVSALEPPKEKEAPPAPPVKEEQNDYEEEAKRILAQAETEAAELKRKALEEAEKEAQRLKQEAHEEGFQAGVLEGRERAYREESERTEKALNEMDRELEEALSEISRAKEECLERYLGELLDCSLAVAEKVVQISLRSSGEVMKKMILSAAEKLKQSAWVKIYVSRKDYSAVMKADADLAGKLSALSGHIRFVVMDQEAEGVCLIETPDEILDASVSTQMEHIRDILGGARPKSYV